MTHVNMHIRPRSPFRLDLTVWALRRQPHNRIDRWDGRTYSRVFIVDGVPLMVEVAQTGPAEDPRLSVRISSRKMIPEEKVKREVRFLLGKVLGTSEDLQGFYRITRKDARLSALAKGFIGLNPPCFPSVFEAIINAFACQQLSLNVGITLLNRLSEAYGASMRAETGSIHAFPAQEDLADARQATLRRLGFSRNKGQAIITLARSVLDGELDLENLETKSDQDVVDVLQEITGVGRWTAEYVLLRGLRRLNVFPGDDVGAQNNLQRFLSLKKRPDYATIKRIMLHWKPYGGFIYFHFLLQKLRSKGFLQAGK